MKQQEMSTILPNRQHNIKEQLNGKSLWSLDLKAGLDLDGWWIDDDRLTHGLLFSAVLLAYLLVCRKISRILFFRKSYDKSYNPIALIMLG